MRKDYVAVSDALAAADERTVVEDYWTRVWDGRALNPAARAEVERRDEFRVMDPYLRLLRPGSRVLDGGCGLGEWTLYYQARGFDMVGLDISAATVERLKSRFPGHAFVIADVRCTGFPDASFAAYFSWGTFEHFEEGLGRCFEEARRILEPGGYLFVSVPFHNRRLLRRDQRMLREWDEDFSEGHGYARPMRFYQWRLTHPELQREFELHGFKVLGIHPIQKGHGAHRAAKHDLNLRPGTLTYRLARRALALLLPKQYLAHMILGVGQRRTP